MYSWDITKLAGPVKGKYFDCYLMIDIHSRFIVGAQVHASEAAILAAEMMKEIFGIHGIPQVVHADRGTSMTSKTVAALLSDLEVTRSHSRPQVSNDNPYSESLLKTMKYGRTFPERFASLGEARAFINGYVSSSLSRPLKLSKVGHFSTVLSHSGTTDPKILALPGPAWINQP